MLYHQYHAEIMGILVTAYYLSPVFDGILFNYLAQLRIKTTILILKSTH